MEIKWHESSNIYSQREVSNYVDTLPVAVYNLGFNQMSSQFYLTRMQDKFEFAYKVYGIESKFINRVIKTYDNTNNNLGILLNGVKGTGKTVTAELLCNQLQQPVIIVGTAYDSIPEYINSIQQNITLFFDEYEKIYSDHDHSILTVMDGVMSNEYRRVFLLTTNNRYINENMLERPSRIRYIKEFKDLSLEVIMEIIDDKLKHVEFKDDLIKYISSLKIITVDIVKTIVDEVNIHAETTANFKDIINAKVSDDSWNVLIKMGDEFKVGYKGVKISPMEFTEDSVDDYLTINGQEMAEIIQVIDSETAVVEILDYRQGHFESAVLGQMNTAQRLQYSQEFQPLTLPKDVKKPRATKQELQKIFTVKIDKIYTSHKTFYGYF